VIETQKTDYHYSSLPPRRKTIKKPVVPLSGLLTVGARQRWRIAV
jgi:hypothetical protein